MLCGVRIPFDCGVVAHSDGDVGIHALCDALLGALALGDIGRHFPPSSEKWKGADSRVLLRSDVNLMHEQRYELANADITIICERPRVGPHVDAMRATLAKDLATTIDCVSVKATTTEKLGFTGRGEGIAAQAVATLRLPL